ncbi:hypothetical protein F5880DRAFT_1618055 [Lentinula raphanica]|nr:hypothetical protein F5880DRAFT_1618055 [Lentinula raphanica]
MVKMRFDIVLFSSLAVYAVSAIPVTVPADNGGNNASPNPNRPGRVSIVLFVHVTYESAMPVTVCSTLPGLAPASIWTPFGALLF